VEYLSQSVLCSSTDVGLVSTDKSIQIKRFIFLDQVPLCRALSPVACTTDSDAAGLPRCRCGRPRFWYSMVVPETWYFWYSMVQALPDPEGLEGLLGVPDMRSQMLMGPAQRGVGWTAGSECFPLQKEGIEPMIFPLCTRTAKGRN